MHRLLRGRFVSRPFMHVFAGTHRGGLVGVDPTKTAPFRWVLVVDQDLWFRKIGPEAIGDSELHRDGLTVIGPASAPAIQNEAGAMQLANALDDRGDGNALGSVRANQRVVNVDVYDRWAGHSPILPQPREGCAPPTKPQPTTLPKRQLRLPHSKAPAP